MIDGESNSEAVAVEPQAFEASSTYPTYASQVFLSNRLFEASEGLTAEDAQGLSFILALMADDTRADHDERMGVE